ncbi:MAG: hypothetical protein NXH83_00885 [Rhodobacteraceae bacterium]|jgi:hypothetical protein|nr:hypothetical protein [Paracoccaceae bacterium]
MKDLGHGMRGMGLLIDLNRDRLVFPLAVFAALTLAAVLGGALLHPAYPVEPFPY